MNEKRTRQDTFYLQNVYDPVLLHPDGTIGELVEKNVDVKVRLPSRVEGRERVGVQTQQCLAEVALHDSLENYLVGRRGNTLVKRPHNNGWRLADMPKETISAYKEWRNEPQALALNDVRELAVLSAASQEDRLTQSVACPNCSNTALTQYACYTCGYARELYSYPLVRYHDADSTYDVPFDAAEAIRLNPGSLKYTTEWEIDDEGMMSAERKLVFDVRKLPKEYVTGVPNDGELTISKSDPLSNNIEIPVEKWSEQGNSVKLRPSALRSSRLSETADVDLTPGLYLAKLQDDIAFSMYRERKDGKDYNAMLHELHRAVGRHGLELVFRHKYMGMGDSEGQFMIAKRRSGYVQTQVIAGSYLAELALEDAIEKIHKSSL